MPELTIRKAMIEARDLQVNEVTPYGPCMITLPVELESGAMDELVIVNPFAQLWTAAKKCEGFSCLIIATCASHPPSFEKPWGFILYSDEVVPGNQLSFHNLRKCWAVYFSFMEFGEVTLSNEDAWFCTSAERTDRVKKMGGGIGQLFGIILEYLFSDGGHSLMTSGLELELFDGSTVRIWADLRMVLQDGGAHKQVWMVKGDGGIKACLECRNFYSRKSGIASEEGEDMLTCSSHRMQDMDFATDEDVAGTVQRLAWVAENRNGELKLREQACGFNHNKFNMLLNPRLTNVVKPIKVMAHDWMHTFAVHGVWNTIIFLLVLSLQMCDKTVVKGLHAFIALWTLPRRLKMSGEDLADAFSHGRWTSSVKAKYLKCTASHAISIYNIICCYIQHVYVRAEICLDACRAYMSLCDVLDLLVVLPRGHVTWEQLNEAIDKFLQDCIKAGWQTYMHPKFHWTLHLVKEFRKFGMLLTCWVHERKHRMVKRYTNNQRNTQSYESSILKEITCQHLHDLMPKFKFSLEVSLQEPITTCSAHMVKMLSESLNASGAAFTTSRSVRASKFEIVHVGDIVVFQDETRLGAAHVKHLVAIDGLPLAIIDHFSVASKNVQQGTVDAVDNGSCKIVRASTILAACSYRRKANGMIQILVPVIYRNSIE